MLKRAQAYSFRYLTHAVPCDLLFQWKKVTFQIANIFRSQRKVILKIIFEYEYDIFEYFLGKITIYRE